jgi:hypothetical protein
MTKRCRIAFENRHRLKKGLDFEEVVNRVRICRGRRNTLEFGTKIVHETQTIVRRLIVGMVL